MATHQVSLCLFWMLIATCAHQLLGFSIPSIRRQVLSIRPIDAKLDILIHRRHAVLGTGRTIQLRLASAPSDLSEVDKSKLEEIIKIKGEQIRALKADGAEKSVVAPLVQELLALKGQLEPSPKTQQGPREAKKQPKDGVKDQSNDEESDFITARGVDYSRWYNDLIRVTGLAENSPVRGCMVIKPLGMALWDRIRTELDIKIQEHGAENAYFPLLIPKSFLSKEAEHVDGFAKECAVVTHHRLTAGADGLVADPEAKLEEPLIIRPTSETMIWFMFRKWIKSYRFVTCRELIY
jgi:prolyl-tRNA synthetase